MPARVCRAVVVRASAEKREVETETPNMQSTTPAPGPADKGLGI